MLYKGPALRVEIKLFLIIFQSIENFLEYFRKRRVARESVADAGEVGPMVGETFALLLEDSAVMKWRLETF